MTVPDAPSTPASGGHDHVEDRAFVARVAALRERDRAVRALVRRFARVALLLLIPVGLAAIAVPNFISFNCRAMSGEAKSGLKTLSVAERTYFLERDTFSTDMEAIGWSPRGSRYSWYVHADASSFHAVAVGAGRLSGDVWQLGTDGAIEHLADGCR